ncbi:MAG TPA: zinc-ribbon domain-containing protein [Candidatus Marinimicrobia bacterium]|nr:zinc-ribbon domain-containing protein [Candidatus Neomarinimicrobiota bacterium]
MECIVCGDENQNDDSKFCSSCGSRLTNQK